MKHVLANLQPVIHALADWTYRNGFAFSTDKTCCMAFHQRPHYPAVPSLKLYNTKILVKQTKFLGLHWDSQLNWKIHISQLKTSCQWALNLWKTLSCREWCASQHVLLQVYRRTIRPKIDYGCLVYGAFAQTVLNQLESVHN